MENDKKYFKGLADTASLEARREAEILKKLENRNSMRSAPIKTQDYTSAIDPNDERMIVKGGTEKINPNEEVARFKNDTTKIDTVTPMATIPNSTDRIDTKQIAKITSGEDFSKKMQDLDMSQKIKATMAQAAKSGDTGMIEKLKLLASKMGNKVPAIAGVAAIGSALMNPSESMASDMMEGAADMVVPTGAEVGSTGFGADSIEGRFERGQLNPQELEEFYKKQALQQMANRGAK